MFRWPALGFVAVTAVSLALTACADSSKLTSPSLKADGAAAFDAGGNGNGNGNANGPFANSARVCPGPENGSSARCHAWIVTDAKGQPVANVTPSGYGP